MLEETTPEIQEPIENQEAPAKSALDEVREGLDIPEPSPAPIPEPPKPGGEGEGLDDAAAKDEHGPEAEPSAEREREGEPADDDGWDAGLIARARFAGFTDAEAKAFGNPENLDRALTAQDRELARIGGQAAGRPPAAPGPAPQAPAPQPVAGAAPAPAPGAPPPVAPTPPSPASAPTAGQPSGYQLKVNEEDYGEELVSDLKGLQAEMRQEISTLRGQLYAAQNQSFEANFDSWLEQKADDRLGTEPTSLLAAGDERYAAREKLMGAFADLTNGIISSGRGRLPPMKQLLDRAHRVAFAGDIERQTRQTISKDIDRQKRVATQRPTARRRPPRNEDNYTKAVKNQEAYMKEHGIEL